MKSIMVNDSIASSAFRAHPSAARAHARAFLAAVRLRARASAGMLR